MNPRCFCLTLFISIIFPISAQKPVALNTIQLFQGRQPETYSLFTPAVEVKEDVAAYLSDAHSFTLRNEIFQELKDHNGPLIRLPMPQPMDISLDLYEVNIFSQGAMISTKAGMAFPPNPANRYYRGMIHGNVNSMAVVSVFQDHIQILYVDQTGNYRIQPQSDGTYIAFADADIRIPKEINCFTQDPDDSDSHTSKAITPHRVMAGNCVEVYIECDYKSFLDNGSSISNTESWVGTLWNEVITLYENEDIPVSVSDVHVYTSYDPFYSINSTVDILYAFAAHIDTLEYDGRLAHLLSTRTLGGGIAFVDVLCSTTIPCAFSSSLSTNIVPFPTYSWSVEVVTHEMGHNMGSSHTHKCVWNGNNTQIDDCGNVWADNNNQNPEGNNCFDEDNPILPYADGGTIMSYCHLISGVGINFNNGFGPLPGNKIRDKYNSASCNTGSCSSPLCTSLSYPSPGAVNMDINTNLYWTAAPGAAGYKLTVSTVLGNGNILDNVDVGPVTSYDLPDALPFLTLIYVKIVPYNEWGEAANCSSQSFLTEANLPPSCTQMVSPENGDTGISTDVIIHWEHAIGNQTGYKISIGTTPNGTQILDEFDVGNVISYDHPTSFPYSTTLYVKIIPYSSSGDVGGCASQSFTTWEPVNGDFCTSAMNINCGQALQGSTIDALPDSGLPFCGTSVDAPGVWYKFTGNGQNAILSTCTQYNYDVKLNAYSGSCTNLNCVTGLDDFCGTGSQISFPTTSGMDYYVLVQGWGGQQGNYTITRSCYSGPFYCQASGLNPNMEWIKSFALGTFVKNSASASYCDFTTDTITVSRGGQYAVTITPEFWQGTRTEYYKIWMDINQDGDFTDANEEIFSAGPTTQPATGTVTIPVTGNTGHTRLRVAMRYNAAPSSPCGSFSFGEVEDYSVTVKCNLVTSTADNGNGSLRNVSLCVDDGEAVLFAPALHNQTLNVTAGPIAVDGSWKWLPANSSNITVKASGNTTRILDIPVGTSIEIQNLKLIGGTASSGSAIYNAGTVILKDCDIHATAGSSNPPLKNSGTLYIQGSTDIRQ